MNWNDFIYNILEISWIHWEKPHKTSVRTDSVPAKIQISTFQIYFLNFPTTPPSSLTCFLRSGNFTLKELTVMKLRWQQLTAAEQKLFAYTQTFERDWSFSSLCCCTLEPCSISSCYVGQIASFSFNYSVRQ